MENGPDLWDVILARLPGGVIMGGCVRDYILQQEPKDIDVFIYDLDRARIMEEVQAGTIAWDFQNDWGGNDRRETYRGMANIIMVEDLLFGKFKVNVITVGEPNPKQRIDDFDLNLNMCLYDYESNSIKVTDQFKDALRTRKIRPNKMPITERTQERAERLVKKYPDFEFVPEVFNGGEVIEDGDDEI